MIRAACPVCGREIGTRPRRDTAAGAFVLTVARHSGRDGYPCAGSSRIVDPESSAIERPPAIFWLAGEPDPPSWDDAIEAFLYSARGRGGRPLARSTRTAYRRDLRHLAQLCVERGITSPLVGLTVPVLADHHAIVCPVGHRITAGMARRVAAVRRFVRWARLHAVDLPSGDELGAWYPSVTAATVRPHPPLESSDLLRVYRAVNGSSFRLDYLRQAVAVSLMLFVGLRRSEVAGLDVRDLMRTPQGDNMLQVRGKGGKEARVPIPPRTLSLVRRYLRATGRDINASGPLIVRLRRPAGDADHRGVGDATIYRMTRALFERAGARRAVSPHGLRRTFSLLCKASGIATSDLQSLLRHSTEAVTVRYARALDPSELADSMPDLPGRRRR